MFCEAAHPASILVECLPQQQGLAGVMACTGDAGVCVCVWGGGVSGERRVGEG